MTPDEYKARLAELEADYKKLEKTIYELKNAEIEEEKPTSPQPRWRPDRYQRYYSINQQSCILQYMWNDSLWDEDAYSIGNVFATKEAAEFAVERLKVLAEMREWARNPFDDYAIALDHDANKFYIKAGTLRGSCPLGEMRFATREDAENCIKAVGADRIKRYYFMVQD